MSKRPAWSLPLLLVFGFLTLQACAKDSIAQTKDLTTSPIQNEDESRNASDRFDLGEERYPTSNVDYQVTSDHGTGYENLYGTRNFRVVLRGLVYRGGANNLYHRTQKRKNENPLPNDGLSNLCQEDFGTAVYLYPTNYSTAAKTTACQTREGGKKNSLNYIQKSVLANSTAAKDVLKLIHTSIVSSDHRPIYMHCWNGWHASGYISALTLRQFCGYTGDQAVSYWNRNAAGSSSSSYDKIRANIRAFQPLPELAISSELRQKLCY